MKLLAWLLLLMPAAGPLTAANHGKTLVWIGAGVRIYTDASGRELLHVQRVAPGGPAERTGMKPGDLVESINGQPIHFRDYVDVAEYIMDRSAGERLLFRGIRNGRPVTLLVVVEAMPESAKPAWERSLAVARHLREVDRNNPRN